MPIHDWTRVDAGLFHAFHQSWIVKLCDALNRGLLPPDYFALPERSISGPVPEVATFGPSVDAADVVVAEAALYVKMADRVAVRDKLRQIVAAIEIVSPGNKASHAELRAFVERVSRLVRHGNALLVIDLFPPTDRDPFGIHKAIWDEFVKEDFELPTENHVLVAAYKSESSVSAFVETISLGGKLPDMPLFLKGDSYVLAPLEASCQTAWADFPAPMKRLLYSPGTGTADVA